MLIYLYFWLFMRQTFIHWFHTSKCKYLISKARKRLIPVITMTTTLTIPVLCKVYVHNNNQQSRKLAAMSNSNAISGAIGNSGISVLLFVYRTLYKKYIQTFERMCDGISRKWTSLVSFSENWPEGHTKVFIMYKLTLHKNFFLRQGFEKTRS